MRTSIHQGSNEYLKLLGFRRFSYLAWPRISARRIILLHGRGESAAVWVRFAQYLYAARSLDIVAFDLRGHGGTPWDPRSEYDISHYMDDLCLQIRHWNRQSILVGHGLGAQIAIASATELGKLIRGLVIIEPNRGDHPKDNLVDILEQAYDRNTNQNYGKYTGQIWERIHHDLAWAKPGNQRTSKCDTTVLNKTPNLKSQSLLLSNIKQPISALLPESRNNESKRNSSFEDTLPDNNEITYFNEPWPHICTPSTIAKMVLDFANRID